MLRVDKDKIINILSSDDFVITATGIGSALLVFTVLIIKLVSG
ncbi:MAG: hypothetical protein QXP59_08110 [Saccharolobus sp.]